MVRVNGNEMIVQILGRAHLNRAMQGDTVAIQIFPEEEWKAPVSVAVEEEEFESNPDVVETETGDEIEKSAGVDVADKIMALEAREDKEDEKQKKPTGRVVGILKRNWRPYCGTIDKMSVKSGQVSSAAQYIFFWAMDRRVPKIRIRTRQANVLLGKRIIVAIDTWDKTSRYLFCQLNFWIPSQFYCLDIPLDIT